jgi:hypothetical protein
MIMFHGMFHLSIIHRPDAWRARGSVRGLAASNEVDYLDDVARVEPDRVVLRTRYHGLVDFDRNPPAAHLEPLE